MNKLLFKYIIKNYSFVINYHIVSDNHSSFEDKNELRHSKNVFITQIKILHKYLNYIDLKKKSLKNNKNYNGYFLITMDDGYFIEKEIIKKSSINPIIFFNYESLIRGFNYPQYFYYTYNNNNFEYSNLKINKNKINIKNNLFFSEKDLISEYFFIADHGLSHFNYKYLKIKKIDIYAHFFKKKFQLFKNYLPFFAIPFGKEKRNYNSETIINLKKNYEFIFLNSNLFNNNNNFKKGIINRFSLPKQINSNDKLISYINYLFLTNFIKLKISIISKIF